MNKWKCPVCGQTYTSKERYEECLNRPISHLDCWWNFPLVVIDFLKMGTFPESVVVSRLEKLKRLLK